MCWLPNNVDFINTVRAVRVNSSIISLMIIFNLWRNKDQVFLCNRPEKHSESTDFRQAVHLPTCYDLHLQYSKYIGRSNTRLTYSLFSHLFTAFLLLYVYCWDTAISPKWDNKQYSIVSCFMVKIPSESVTSPKCNHLFLVPLSMLLKNFSKVP